MSQHHDPVHPEAGHLDADVIADLQIGALDDESAAHARDHLDQCAQCRAVADALDEVSATLAALPPVTVPDDVARRWMEALAAEPVQAASGGATVVPMGTKTPVRSGSWSGRGLAVAASGAGLLLVAALAYPLLTHNDSSPGTSATPMTAASNRDWSAGTSTEAIPAAVVSGTEYRTSSLPQQVTTQLAAYETTSGPVGATVTPSDTAGLSSTPTPTASSSMKPTGESAPFMVVDRNAELACLSAFLTPGSVPLFVDVASFQGQPAVVVVVPATDDSTKVEVWVMARHCTPTQYQVLYFVRMDRP